MWKCILCSTYNSRNASLDRELGLCRGCSSTWRARAVTLAIITNLGYRPQVLNDITPDWSRVGIGISDDVNISSRLASRFFYSNVFFDAFPELDIRKIPPKARSSFEFVSCSDVLEHVDKDLDGAITGLSELLLPSGFAILSVPILESSEYRDFYPDLVSFDIIEGKLEWMNSEGEKFIDLKPEFHGGRGQNIAFRQFTEKSFEEVVLRNGFSSFSNIWIEPKLGVPDLKLKAIYVAKKSSA